MKFVSRFCQDHCAPYEGIEFVDRLSRISGKGGKVLFEMKLVAPAQWGQTAVDILAQKYFRKAGVPNISTQVYEDDVPYWLSRRVPAEGAILGSELDARQTFDRIAGHWTYYGWKRGYFGKDEVSASVFFAEHARMLALQMAAPNSPAWFNLGLYWAYGIEGSDSGQWCSDEASGMIVPSPKAYVRPGVSACHIQSVEDTLVEPGGILDFAAREARVFKYGAGSGANFSPLRGRGEPLSGGGKSSGLPSFLPPIDRFAGAIKSGGTTRRAAKMIVLDMDHPDIEWYISWKANEEKKVALLVAGAKACQKAVKAVYDAQAAKDMAALDKAVGDGIEAGVPYGLLDQAIKLAAEGLPVSHIPEMDTNYLGEAYETVTGQNANNSVGVSKAFMDAVRDDLDWNLYWRTEKTQALTEGRSPVPCKVVKAKDLWDLLARSAWESADPGVQFHDTMDDWNPVKGDGKIDGSNPCQPANATVLTPEGIRTFADIDVGSTIWSGKDWTKVIRKIATGVKKVYEYRTTAGYFLGTEDHRVVTPDGKFPVKSVDDLTSVRGPCPDIELEHDLASVMDGWMIGDGSYLKSMDRVHLHVGDKDEDVLTKLAGHVIAKRPGWGRYAWEVKTSVTKDELPRTWERDVPERYFSGDRVKACSFLRGLYSANGSVCGGRITLKASSFKIISRVQEMLSSVGIASYWTKNKPTLVEFSNGEYLCKESYDLNVTRDRNRFVKLIGFVQDYKQANAVQAAERPKRNWEKTVYEIVETAERGEVDVFDIEVAHDDHTYWTSGVIVSNCSEYLFLKDTSCNLGCLNLVPLVDPTDWEKTAADMAHAVRLYTVALDISVGLAGYPSKNLATGAANYRTLGLGYSNLGAVLMRNGIPYDSDAGRGWAAALTGLIHFGAIETSADLAAELGAFPRYEANREHVNRVLSNHYEYVTKQRYEGLTVQPVDPTIAFAATPVQLVKAVSAAGHKAMTAAGCKTGIRNAQVTLVMPAGTVGLLMGCDTTGVEPDFALVKDKALSDGGWIQIVNNSVGPALTHLGYTTPEVEAIVGYVREKGTIEGAPNLKDEHLPVFDCANKCGADGKRAISVSGHLRMMAAVQPLLSGGISKTINMPLEATVEDIRVAYTTSHDLMIKCVALYRDSSKLSQPLSSAGRVQGHKTSGPKPMTRAERRNLPNKRTGHTQKFRTGGHKFYLTTGEYGDGALGEVFLTCDKEGGFLQSVTSIWSKVVSIGLQYGVPLEEFVAALMNTRFEPNGPVQGHDRLRNCTSLFDAIAKHLAIEYLDREDLAHVTPGKKGKAESTQADPVPKKSAKVEQPFEGTPCSNCGLLRMVRDGKCATCQNCGTTSGCV